MQNKGRFVFVHLRLISERGEELAVDQLSKDLKTLAKQTKATKYREVMKLLRLALSGLQVPEDIIFEIDCNTPAARFPVLTRRCVGFKLSLTQTPNYL